MFLLLSLDEVKVPLVFYQKLIGIKFWPLSFLCLKVGVELLPNFQKGGGGLDRTSVFRGGLLGNRR